MQKYHLTFDKLQDDFGTVHTVYGVKITNSRNKIIVFLPNVFADKRQAKRFVQTCNKYKLSPIHFMDAIEDALST